MLDVAAVGLAWKQLITPPPTLADISTGNSTLVDIKITYALPIAACLIAAMRRAHIAQSAVELAVLVWRELQSRGSLPKN